MAPPCSADVQSGPGFVLCARTAPTDGGRAMVHRNRACARRRRPPSGSTETRAERNKRTIGLLDRRLPAPPHPPPIPIRHPTLVYCTHVLYPRPAGPTDTSPAAPARCKFFSRLRRRIIACHGVWGEVTRTANPANPISHMADASYPTETHWAPDKQQEYYYY